MTMDMEEKPRGVGRPRSAASHQAILDATFELVAEQGVQGASIEAIAARAGVGKTTIYRRWPSKEALVADTLGQLHLQLQLPNTGSLRGDLVALATELLQHMRQKGVHPLFERMLLRVIGEAQTHPEFLQILYDRVYAPRLGLMGRLIERAQARGELRPNLDPMFMASLIGGPVLFHLLAAQIMPSPASPSWDDLPERIVDAVLRGVGTSMKDEG
jgi:AcrR family transcriptional regulator